jgi:hypothetical protein
VTKISNGSLFESAAPSQVGPEMVGPDGCSHMTTARHRDKKEILSMSGQMSERATDITIEADGRAESTTVELFW